MASKALLQTISNFVTEVRDANSEEEIGRCVQQTLSALKSKGVEEESAANMLCDAIVTLKDRDQNLFHAFILLRKSK